MKFLFLLLLVTVLGPRAARSYTPNADFVAKIVGLLTLNADDDAAWTCLNDFAQAADNASPPLGIIYAGFVTATRDASLMLKACLDDAMDGTLKEVAVIVFAPLLDVANNVEEFDIALSSVCVQDESTSNALSGDQRACWETDCDNVTLVANMMDLLDLLVLVSLQVENDLCKPIGHMQIMTRCVMH